MIFQVLLMSLKTGGDSLDLTAASNVFLMVYSVFIYVSSDINLYFGINYVLFILFRIHPGIQMLRRKQ